MQYFDYRCGLRPLVRVFITASVFIFFSLAGADEVPGQPSDRDSGRPGPIGIAVSGSSAGITTDYFEQAVTEAVDASGIFSGVDDSAKVEVVMPMIRAEGIFPSVEITTNTPYFLHVRIIKVDTPSFSVRMTVGINVIWTLFRTSDKAELLKEKIYSDYTGGVFEGGIHGANRVRVAMEGAMRENIKVGIVKLESLNFEQGNNHAQVTSPEVSGT